MNIFFISLGCDKNKVDSEKILGFFLRKKNVLIVDSPFIADLVIINTCSFIKDAKIESISTIKYFLNLKRKKIIKMLMVIGCLAEEATKNKDTSNNKVFDRAKIENYGNYHTGYLYNRIFKGDYNLYNDIFKDIDIILPLNRYLDALDTIYERALDILSFSSSIKICEGCDKFCSYCIIPYLRGRFRSRGIDEIYNECKILAKNGVKELNIVGQDVLSYGKDNYGKRSIKELINKVSKISGISWIRLLYCYPEEIDDDIISLIKNNTKVLPYIDMPIQHISNNILKNMNRHTTKESIINIINKLRNNIPDIIIRTTLMVGFPGETNEDFEELCDFIEDIKFDKLGVFKYSDENLAKAYRFTNKISEKVKEKRLKKIMAIQKNIVYNINREKLGKVYYSIVEGYDINKKAYIVRPYFNARDIDDRVYVKTKEELISGSFVNVELIKVIGMDFIGQIV